MEQDNLARLDQLLNMLAQGQFVEGMEEFFADDVQIQEMDAEPKVGKQFCIEAEKKLLETVTEFGGYRVHSKAASGDKTFYEATMEFKTSDQHVVLNQCVVTTWKDGKIVFERYYNGGF
ncbi:MAG: ester cyclase [Pseudomonadota bacterium]